MHSSERHYIMPVLLLTLVILSPAVRADQAV